MLGEETSRNHQAYKERLPGNLTKFFGKDGRILASGNIGNLGMTKLLFSLGVR